MLQFRVSSQVLERVDDNAVYSDTINYLKCRFDVSDDWDGVACGALFYTAQPTGTRDQAIDKILTDGICDVPVAFQTKSAMWVSLYGNIKVTKTTEEGTTTDETKRITTNYVKIPIKTAAYTSNVAGDAEASKTALDELTKSIGVWKAELETKYDKAIQCDKCMHIAEDWITSEDTSNCVVNHEIRTFEGSEVNLLPYAIKYAQEGIFDDLATDVWTLTDASGKEYECEYHFTVTYNGTDGVLKYKYDDDELTLTELTEVTFTKGNTYEIYIRDEMSVITDKGVIESGD